MFTEIIIAIAGGALGAITALAAGIYRKSKDRKETWWERFTWAADTMQSTDKAQKAAAREILKGLAADPKAPLADRKAADALTAEEPITFLMADGSQTRF